MSGSHKKTVIDDALIKQFEKDGAVCIRKAVDGQKIGHLVENVQGLINSQDERWTTNRLGGFSDRHLWPTHPWMREFCLNSELPAIAAQLMRSDVARLFFDHLFVRDAGTDHGTPWHQDQPYWPFKGRQIASVWVALSACDVNSSGLRFVRGSHRWGKSFAPIAFGKDSGSDAFLKTETEAEAMPDFDASPQDYAFLDWVMEPGDAIVFGADVVHGAKANTASESGRMALSVRYVGDDARWDPRPGTDPIVSADQVSIKAGDAPLDDTWFPVAYP